MVWMLFIFLLNSSASPPCEDICAFPTPITGIVKYENGTPVQNANVELYVNGSKTHEIITGSNGFYKFVPMLPTNGVLPVEVKVNAGGINYSYISTISCCGVSKEIDIIVSEKNMSKISGILKYQNGSPVKNATIEIYIDNSYYKSATTNEYGSFEIKLVSNKTHEITIETTINGKKYSSKTTAAGNSVINFNIEINESIDEKNTEKNTNTKTYETSGGGGAFGGGAGGVISELPCFECKSSTIVFGTIKYVDGMGIENVSLKIYLNNILFSNLSTNNEGAYLLSVEKGLCKNLKQEIDVEAVINNKIYANKSTISCGTRENINITIPVEVCKLKTEVKGEIKYKNNSPVENIIITIYLDETYIGSINSDASGIYSLNLDKIYTHITHTVEIMAQIKNKSYSKKDAISCGDTKTINIGNIETIESINNIEVYKEISNNTNKDIHEEQKSKLHENEILIPIIVILLLLGVVIIYIVIKRR